MTHSEPAREAVEALARKLANAKLGEGPSIRCEGPTEFEVEQARAWARRALRVLSASPAPAAGGLEAVRAEIKEYAPAGGDRVMIWVNDRDTRQGGYCLECVPRHVAPIIVAALAAPAATSAETHGGDGVREALELARPVIAGLIDAEYNVDTWGLKGRLAKIDAALGQSRVCEVCGGDCSAANPPPSYCPERAAALAPSTPAATRGEPVFQGHECRMPPYRYQEPDNRSCSATYPGSLPVTPHKPAPAVESAQVKEAVAAEREACARICETQAEADPNREDHCSDYLDGFTSGSETTASYLAASIRIRASLATDAEG